MAIALTADVYECVYVHVCVCVCLYPARSSVYCRSALALDISKIFSNRTCGKRSLDLVLLMCCMKSNGSLIALKRLDKCAIK